ncbi:MAG: hypothetical protein WA081_10360 [Desulfosalsimonadaceae bacterium]
MAQKKPKKKKSKKGSLVKEKRQELRGNELKKYSHLQHSSFEITGEPIEDPSIPDELKDEAEILFEKCLNTPAFAVERLEALIKKYPNIPVFYNYISVAYSRMGDREKTKHYVEANYRNNPRYLFAKLNYAEICMNEGNYDKIPEILENKFIIKVLYPERNVFHITEMVNFTGIVGLYFAHIDNREQVEMNYNILKQLAPKHPFTKKLNRYLIFYSVKSGINKLMGGTGKDK